MYGMPSSRARPAWPQACSGGVFAHDQARHAGSRHQGARNTRLQQVTAFRLLQFGDVDRGHFDAGRADPRMREREACGRYHPLADAQHVRGVLFGRIDLDDAIGRERLARHPCRLQQHGGVVERGHGRLQVQAAVRRNGLHRVAM
ncbi:MAG TPA: hypothetical protein VF422_04970 [Dokdonella sp.]